jgi:hypothetical protein
LDDLAAYEQGTLSRSEVVARHGVEALPALAAHDRLREAVATVPAFDVDAGWARVIEEIAEPAPVVRLPSAARRPRASLLAAVAAVLLAGSAFAALGPRLLADDRPMVPVEMDGGGVPLDGDPRGDGGADAQGSSQDDAGGGGAGSTAQGDDRPGGTEDPDRPGVGATGSNDDDDGGAPDDDGGGGPGDPGDTEDPNDRDQGRGNDGEHDDNGRGNDGAEGEDKPHKDKPPKDKPHKDKPQKHEPSKGKPTDR